MIYRPDPLPSFPPSQRAGELYAVGPEAERAALLVALVPAMRLVLAEVARVTEGMVNRQRTNVKGCRCLFRSRSLGSRAP